MSSKDAAGRAHSCFPFGALTQAKQPVLDFIRPSAGLYPPLCWGSPVWSSGNPQVDCPCWGMFSPTQPRSEGPCREGRAPGGSPWLLLVSSDVS